MKVSLNSTCLGAGCGGRNVLVRPESEELRSLAALAGKCFQAPIAYAAMLGHHDRVMCRIGSGQEHWQYLRTLPLARALASPMVVRDGWDGPPDTDLGDLRFMASAPIYTLCRQHLGVLVIADRFARPEFSEKQLEILEELAAVIASRVELTLVASQSADLRLRYDEAEERFRRIANSAGALIACHDVDGSCRFVSDAWLEFTGRDGRSLLGDGWQQVIQQEHREDVLNLYWQSLQGRRPFRAGAPLSRHDGGFPRMRVDGTPRFFSDGSFAGFVLHWTPG